MYKLKTNSAIKAPMGAFIAELRWQDIISRGYHDYRGGGIKYFNPHSSFVLTHCKGTILGCLHNLTFTLALVVDAAKVQDAMDYHTMKLLLVLHA